MTRQTISKIEKVQESIFQKCGRELKVLLVVQREKSPEYVVTCSTTADTMYQLPEEEYIEFDDKMLMDYIYKLESSINEDLLTNSLED